MHPHFGRNVAIGMRSAKMIFRGDGWVWFCKPGFGCKFHSTRQDGQLT